MIPHLMGDFLGQIAEAEARVAELHGRLQANAPADDEDGEEVEDDAERMSEAEAKEVKRALAAAKKALKAFHKTLADRLEKARGALSPNEGRDLVLEILKGELKRELDRYVTAHRQRVVAAAETWWDKYRVPLRDIERDRHAVEVQLQGFLKELGYDG